MVDTDFDTNTPKDPSANFCAICGVITAKNCSICKAVYYCS